MNQQSQVAFYVKCVSMTLFDIVWIGHTSATYFNDITVLLTTFKPSHPIVHYDDTGDKVWTILPVSRT